MHTIGNKHRRHCLFPLQRFLLCPHGEEGAKQLCVHCVGRTPQPWPNTLSIPPFTQILVKCMSSMELNSFSSLKTPIACGKGPKLGFKFVFQILRCAAQADLGTFTCNVGPNFAPRAQCGRTIGALRAHYGRTAGTCIKDHPKEKEGGNIKHADATTQHNNLILRCVKSVVLTVTNPNSTMQRHTRGAHVQMTCATLRYIFMTLST